jgi:uroporphyrinogen III methyltransferase/synthase
MPENRVDTISKMLEAKNIDMITFTSSSTVTNFMGMFGNNVDQVKEWLKDVDIASIGPITSETAEKLGLKVTAEPENYTIEALTDSIVRHYS